MAPRRLIPWLLFPLLFTARGQAASSAQVVWYRASEGCPAGPVFLEKLWAKAPLARLMQAGDHIDFVVTLVAEQGETIGRLERQTDNGTVAIRELRDPVCERVADALALSLALSLEARKEAQPVTSESEMSTATPEEEAPETPAEGESKPSVTNQQQRPTQRRVPEKRTVLVDRGAELIAVPSDSDSGAQGSLGVEGGALLGAAPNALARSEVFLNLDKLGLAWDRRLSLRFGVVGALGAADTKVGPLRRSILALRTEACPWRFGSETLSVSPCAAMELGVTGANASRTKASATGVWSVLASGVRAGVVVLPRLTLEAQMEAQFPLIRNQVDAGSVVVYRADPVALQGGLGLSWRVW